MERRKVKRKTNITRAEEKAELIANEIMMGVQASKYHTCIYNKASNDFNHSHLIQAALKGLRLGLEQKSAEWSKEDEEMRINILQEIANIKDVFPKINIQPEFDWLKSLPERFNLQPKQEWTIEDAKPGDILHTSSTASSKTFIFKRIRNDEHGSVECFCCYDSEDGFRKGEEELIGWKTDKYRLATPKQCIKLGRIMGKAGYIFHFETNQLQKLNKPQWKPSDKQMEALDGAQGELCGTKYNEGLCSLIDDLKKLSYEQIH